MNTLPLIDSLGPLIKAPTGTYHPTLEFERKLEKFGHRFVAGIDEAGRGPLAGPVVAAAVILGSDFDPMGLDDSKKMSAKKREQLFGHIIKTCHVSIATNSNHAIDQSNIRAATLDCMVRSAAALQVIADWLLIDGRDIPHPLQDRATAIIKGDGRSISIAAASVIAKVSRDQMMVRAASIYPQYGFENHKGYGTKAHLTAIKKHGPCPLHRFSFAPIRTH